MESESTKIQNILKITNTGAPLKLVLTEPDCKYKYRKAAQCDHFGSD